MNNYNPHLNKRNEKGNKGTFGRVLVIAGNENMSGCVYFSAYAALKSGCGLVNVLTDKNNIEAMKVLVPEAILDWSDNIKHPVFDPNDNFFKDKLDKLLKNADSVVIGPGLGVREDTLKVTEYVLKNYNGNIIVDADSLNSISVKYKFKDVFKEDYKADTNHPLYNVGRNRTVVITPHMLELARLCNSKCDDVKNSLDDLAVKIAKEYGIITVFKDSSTRVSDGIDLYVNKSGNSSLSTAGTGDILTGMIASLLIGEEYPFRGVNTAVYLHGRAGEFAGKELSSYCVTARDVLQYIPKAFSSLKFDDRIYNNCVILEVMNANNNATKK
ncbi:MAG: NAD(P)H-hydrate dehydratase [Lachnospiraceae bacterium]|nr:NAD(P)H-hydrate dehydratase [Lachnospiraceae bacterium]